MAALFGVGLSELLGVAGRSEMDTNRASHSQVMLFGVILV